MIESKEDIRNLTSEQRDALLLACLDALSTEAMDSNSELASLDRMTSGNWMHKNSFIKARIQNRKETIQRISEVADIDFRNFSSEDAFDELLEAFSIRS